MLCQAVLKRLLSGKSGLVPTCGYTFMRNLHVMQQIKENGIGRTENDSQPRLFCMDVHTTTPVGLQTGLSPWPMHRTQTAIQPCRNLYNTNKRLSTKGGLQPAEEEVGAFTKIIETLGFTGPLKYSKWKIKIAALRMYTCCVERIDYDEFFDRCCLPDTLNSWFLVTQLHVWMCLVRLKQEGRAGKYMCRYVVYVMWEDVTQRGKVMGIDSVALKNSMRVMMENFYAAVFGYDEGILSDDRVLAGALWRNLFNKQCEDPRHLEFMVEYVRKQMQYLDSLVGEDLLLTGDVVWRPLMEHDPQSILKLPSPTYNDEGL
uniref:Ubiquinol-cytochrome-c reductase complex assembly factor 1 isoform X1 n=2 Tax=Geotrypetes seraphini TaxID=260995 RepID=A0A6P8NMY5_GEOSA|nr:ubiquinol-cytochrome-c reductase complex assembly factor 1 isoform X1 [Geotrypetes seraphini]